MVSHVYELRVSFGTFPRRVLVGSLSPIGYVFVLVCTGSIATTRGAGSYRFSLCSCGGSVGPSFVGGEGRVISRPRRTTAITLLADFLPAPFPFRGFPSLLPVRENCLFYLVYGSTFRVVVAMAIVLRVRAYRGLLEHGDVVRVVAIVLCFGLGTTNFVVEGRP